MQINNKKVCEINKTAYRKV